MGKKAFESIRDRYHQSLFGDVIPFWEQHSMDTENGGYYTCLDRSGEVYDTDKFIWLQARQVWMFGKLFEHTSNQLRWKEIAIHGGAFLAKNGRSPDGRWYFALDQKGSPLVAPYNIFSDCFATMAFHQLFEITGESNYLDIAHKTWKQILERQNNPKGIWNKQLASRPMQNFALPMILANLAIECDSLTPPNQLNSLLEELITSVMDTFYDPASGLVLENVGPNGELIDSFEGRLINPGHAIEAMSFMIDIGIVLNRHDLIETCAKRALAMLQFGWDAEQGGIFYFLDRLNKPPQQLEWDQKLWWVHLEALVAFVKAYQITQDPLYWNAFLQVDKYTWTHFPDPEYGEWFGYLNRSGSPLLPLKGGKWKGFFHVPRSLWQIIQWLDRCIAES